MITSPDSLVDACVMKDLSGGMGGTDNGILIYLVPSGDSIKDFGAEYFSAEKVSGLSVRWVKSKLLDIYHDSGEKHQ